MVLKVATLIVLVLAFSGSAEALEVMLSPCQQATLTLTPTASPGVFEASGSLLNLCLSFLAPAPVPTTGTVVVRDGLTVLYLTRPAFLAQNAILAVVDAQGHGVWGDVMGTVEVAP